MFTQSVILAIFLAFCMPVTKSFDCSESEIDDAITCFTAKLKSCACDQEYSCCSDILEDKPEATSGNYTLTINGEKVIVYCEMGTKGVCGGEGGWMRIANYDVAGGSACPVGLSTYIRKDKTFCDRKQEVSGGRCDSTFFDTNGISYNKVCGRVRGYQFDNTGYVDGVYPNYRNNKNDLNGYYVDGVSVTRGSPREHVWTFANGVLENRAGWTDCPCNTGSSTSSPSYVGENYYCESATSRGNLYTLYLSDPLWDGKDCNAKESPCCKNPNLPYFVRSLDQASTDKIELRVCSSEGLPDESTAIDLVEIYVK